ncbi:YeeE/YedE family protein [Halomonas sp. KAO]|uniref:YeeE/YedE family protein n=1 Tax=unclassified Halomonas TaxID=2609666 RepID=UPI0018A00EB6|nr:MULTISPECIES: YeeE/YedE family protein [unclassified Halomonas]MBF7052963.1 YeeE/YedE family protein [Halomonas sp. KAO]MDT0500738.1 YeeE/YedE family protein [Halomonas sp. PAR7]MDT0513072.1 YeeE/YedE family protein [Halomonas sp. LES1]MDT0591517.1 YeeE/YedE family protein [Halomonas sp. PAR8]
MDWSSSLQGLAGGVLIGLSATWLMATLGRIAGISGIVGTLITARPKGDSAWRLTFLLGMISGPIVVMLLGGGLGNVAGDAVDVTGRVIGEPAGGVALMLLAGLLVGLGTGLGSGCTSGHGVCGLARLSVRSMVATITFLVAAIVTVFMVRHVVGGGA